MCKNLYIEKCLTFWELCRRHLSWQTVIEFTLQMITAIKFKCLTLKALHHMKSDEWGQFTKVRGLELVVSCETLHLQYNRLIMPKT